MKEYKAVETKYWEDGTMEDCVIEWAKENGYKVSRTKNFNLSVCIDKIVYEVVNYKVCKDGMVLVDLRVD